MSALPPSFRCLLPGLSALVALFAGLAVSATAIQAQDAVVDLELVLAVDASSSVSDDEFDLQMRGLAEAFRHEAVLAAIQAMGDRGLAISVIQWSDAKSQMVAVDWMEVFDGPSAEAFAVEIEKTPRFLIGGSTAVGSAIAFSQRQLEINGYEGRRKVIDISGDGRTNQGPGPEEPRAAAVAAGITINGLAILNEDLYVDRYYSRAVIGGTGAFVMTADDYEAFAQAILLKLIREIAGTPVASLPPGPRGLGRVDRAPHDG